MSKVRIRFDGPSDLLDVGDGQVIERGGTGEVDEKLAKELDEADYVDITIAGAGGKFAKPTAAPEPAPVEAPAKSPAEQAADVPTLGQPAETTPDKKKEV